MLSRSYLTEAIPIQTLVWLRVALGLLGGGDILGNGIYYHGYLNHFKDFTFRYYGFEWVYPLPEPFLSAFFLVGFLAGLAVAVGYRFRLSAPLLALCFSYLFLLEKAHYLNHAYLFACLSWLLVLTPAWRSLSVDVWRNPASESQYTPRWSLIIFPVLMGIVYCFGGIAKLNEDWLFKASPLHDWISGRSNTFLIGPLLKYKTTAYLMAWSGCLLDLSIAFFLLHKRLRWWALAAALFFHATNHLIFNIGIFPYLSLILTSLWFEPNWPSKVIAFLALRFKIVSNWNARWEQHFVDYRSSHPDTEPTTSSSQLSYTGHSPFVGHVVDDSGKKISINQFFKSFDRAILSKPLTILLGVVMLFHLLYPLRHHFIAGDVAWTEEGHRYSWRMMLRSKTGTGNFILVDAITANRETYYPHGKLTKRQTRKLFTHPDMILQYAHHIAAEYKQRTGNECAVYADIKVRLNDGKYYPYIDPNVDLSTIEWTWLTRKKWVLKEGV